MNRVLNFIVIAFSAVTFLICDPLNAAVINLTEGSPSGYTMAGDNTYVVSSSVSFFDKATKQ